VPAEFVYTNPPLREVIVEYRWSLTSLKIVEGVQIDPFYQSTAQKITDAMASIGFAVVENRIPEDAPIELLAYQPIRLFRQRPDTWPIYQIGPGIFVANAIPPYGGWSSFVPHIEKGLRQLYASYPEEFLAPQRVVLRYLNAFQSSHGMVTPASFIRNSLKLASPLPDAIVSTAEGGLDNVLQTGNIRMSLMAPPGGIGRIIWGSGRFKNEEAVNLELRAIIPTTEKKPEVVIALLNDAHTSISSWFEMMIPNEVRSHFGERKKVDR
jgi:uncharacterized protein (TIGR04255 family)